jgi:hypothetical protein
LSYFLLFLDRAPAPEHLALEMLRAVDIDRLTPLEALQLLANLRQMSRAGTGEGSREGS